MSMLTSVGGMLPLILMPGSGSELYRGLGSVVVGGLLVSTVFTLLLVPLLLSLVLDLTHRTPRDEENRLSLTVAARSGPVAAAGYFFDGSRKSRTGCGDEWRRKGTPSRVVRGPESQGESQDTGRRGPGRTASCSRRTSLIRPTRSCAICLRRERTRADAPRSSSTRGCGRRGPAWASRSPPTPTLTRAS